MPPSGGRVYALPMRTASARSAPANDLPAPTPSVLASGVDAPALERAVAALSRPLVCACGQSETDPGPPVGVQVVLLRNGRAAVEAACVRCARDPATLSGFGGVMPRPPSRRRA